MRTQKDHSTGFGSKLWTFGWRGGGTNPPNLPPSLRPCCKREKFARVLRAHCKTLCFLLVFAGDARTFCDFMLIIRKITIQNGRRGADGGSYRTKGHS